MLKSPIEYLDKEELLNLLGYYNNYIVDFFDTHERDMQPVSIYEYFDNEYQEIIEKEQIEEIEGV